MEREWEEFGELPKHGSNVRSHTNDGCDAFGREIKIGDRLMRIQSGGNGACRPYTETVDRVSFGKDFKSVATKTSYGFSDPVRWSGRTIILERASLEDN